MNYTKLAVFQFPSSSIFGWPAKESPIPPCPFNNISDTLAKIYEYSLKPEVPLAIAFVYFTSVHLMNTYLRKQQIANAKQKGLKIDVNDPKSLKKLPPVPYWFAKTFLFKAFVFLHNVFLCVYSVWTFIGITSSIKLTSYNYSQVLNNLIDSTGQVISHPTSSSSKNLFWNTVCDLNNGIFSPDLTRGLSYYGYLFYISKFYEVVDTMIILSKGRPSSLLQSYHHSGAMLSMWAGVRYVSPPIWIFVAFNSFIHSIMYFYYSLSTLHIRVPNIFKKSLTTMQICQFVIGGSLAVVHLFVHYFEYQTGAFKPCIRDSNQLFALYVNVFYLFPLTVLFMAFWIESYARRMSKQKRE